MSMELLTKLKQKKEVYGMWKKGQVTQEYRNVVRVCRDAAGKRKVRLEISLARDVKDISSKRKTKENVCFHKNFSKYVIRLSLTESNLVIGVQTLYYWCNTEAKLNDT